ncbi:MAG TPA: TonB-dependent receptor [Anaeromyxobacteraceae bacterium]|nr:TonB-dependent receptor [Anaeromyxobacteraceae bacterium]
MVRPHASSLWIAVATLWAGTGAAQRPAEADPGFWDPLVVTPTGQASRVSEAPSTTFVITGDEARRSGAPSLPELLRRVPGLDVRLISATDGQLGLRGFAYEVSDRILLLVDGRTAYIDFFGGASWEMLPVSLVDIERIEIVLGPGASVYGNKAMLGTINVITRSAADYPYPEARLDVGLPADGRAAARYGAIAGPWRLRATGSARNLTLYQPDGRSPAAAGGGTLAATYSPSASREASLEVGAVHGDVYLAPLGEELDAFGATLAYLRARGRLGLGGPGSPGGDLHLDLVWNTGHIDSPTFPNRTGEFEATYQTPYAQLHHELRTAIGGVPLQGRWGGEVWLNTLESTLTSGERDLWNVAGFASTELLLGRVRLTTGVRVDRATLARVTVSPRVSVVWSPVEGHQLRAAFNTGYNNPHHVHYFADFMASPTLPVVGNRGLSPERVLYGELGWAGGLTPWLKAFTNAFVYRFTDWLSLDPANATTGVPWGNNNPFTAWGGEAGLDVSLRRTCSAYATWAFVGPGARVYPYHVDPLASPRHKVSAGVRLDLPAGAWLTADAQYFGPSVIARVGQGSTAQAPFVETRLGEYVMIHARAGYSLRDGLDLSVAVADALDDRTRQFPGAERPERRVSATLAYQR